MDMLDRDGLTEHEFLEQYRAGDFERPSVAADMVIFTVTDSEADSYRKLPEKELRILLIRRGSPFSGQMGAARRLRPSERDDGTGRGKGAA